MSIRDLWDELERKERPGKHEYLLRFAELTATRSTCLRRQVGCVLASPDLETFVVGYNGSFRGGPNGCRFETGSKGLPPAGGCGCVHAEANAVAKAGRGPKIAFLTLAPCVVCAALLVNAGVQEVWFREMYRVQDGLDLLDDAKIPWYHVP